MLPADLGSAHGRGSQDEYSKLGLTAKARVGKSVARIGTLAFRSPVVSNNDTRLLPGTFRGAMVTSQDVDNLTLQGGKIDRIKFNSSSDFVEMSANRIGGTSDSFVFAGGDYRLTQQLTTSLHYGNLEDIYKQYYGGLQYLLPLADKRSLKLDLRYARSTEDGNFRDLTTRRWAPW